MTPKTRLTFRIFLIFFSARGRGTGSPRGGEKGEDDFLLKIPGGGVSRVGGGGPRGREGVCRELGGWGLNIFFWGRKAHQENVAINGRKKLHKKILPTSEHRIPQGMNQSKFSAVPKRGRSKRGRTQKHANDLKRAQMSAKERKRKSAKGRKRA